MITPGKWLLPGLAFLLCASGANASVITLLIDPIFGSTEDTGATGLLTFSFAEVGGDDQLSLTIMNTTTPEVGSLLTAIGLELPDLVTPTPSFAPGGQSSYFDSLVFDVKIPPPGVNAPSGYDLVISSDGKFLGGPPNGAPQPGESQTVTLSFGDTGLSIAALTAEFASFYAQNPDNFLIGRFQAVGSTEDDSDRVLGGIPEPASMVLFLTGGLVFLRRIKAS